MFDYLHEDTLVLTHGDVELAARRFSQDTAQRHRFLAHDPERPLLNPDELFLSGEEFFVQCAAFGRWALNNPSNPHAEPSDPPPKKELADRSLQEPGSTPAMSKQDARNTPRERPSFGFQLPDLAIDRRTERPLARLQTFLAEPGLRKLILAESPGRRETLAQLFAEHGLLDEDGVNLAQLDDWAAFDSSEKQIALGVGPLHDGFVLPQAGVALITEAGKIVFTGWEVAVKV